MIQEEKKKSNGKGFGKKNVIMRRVYILITFLHRKSKRIFRKTIRMQKIVKDVNGY